MDDMQHSVATPGCLVSLGIGSLPDISLKGSLFDLIIALLYMATLSTADQLFAAEHQNLVDKRYFRFNVPHDLKTVDLEDPTKLDLIQQVTRKFVSENSGRLDLCARQLGGRSIVK